MIISFNINFLDFSYISDTPPFTSFPQDNLNLLNIVPQDNPTIVSQDNPTIVSQDNPTIANNEYDGEGEESGGVSPATGFLIFTVNVVIAVGGSYIFICEFLKLFK